MKRFEYTQCKLSREDRPGNVHKLNKLGALGWELVAMYYDSYGYFVMATLKRELNIDNIPDATKQAVNNQELSYSLN